MVSVGEKVDGFEESAASSHGPKTLGAVCSVSPPPVQATVIVPAALTLKVRAIGAADAIGTKSSNSSEKRDIAQMVFVLENDRPTGKAFMCAGGLVL
jgi:hypothetical protein